MLMSSKIYVPIFATQSSTTSPSCFSKGNLGQYVRKSVCYASVNSKREHPPGQTPGNSFEVVKSPAPGQNFPAKARLPEQKTPTPGEYFRRSSQPFLLIGVEILGFCRSQTLKRIGRLSNYSVVILSSFSLSTTLKVLKFLPSFETDFVTREQQ